MQRMSLLRGEERVCIYLVGKNSKYCSIKTKNISENRRTKPLLNNDIIKLIWFKHYLYNEYKNSHIPFKAYDAFKKSLSGAIVAVKQHFVWNKFQCSNGKL